jgi:outer membrane protein OmpA-like peptidoglycan-associated protein
MTLCSRLIRCGTLLATVTCIALVGCQTPRAPQPVAVKDTKVVALKNLGFVQANDGWELSLGVKLLFDTDVDTVSEAGRTALGDVSRALRNIGVGAVDVEGHTDNVGTPRYNTALSLRRAESVAQQLVRDGWPSEAVKRKAYGSSRPVADNATPAGRAQNRRVVLTVQVE